MRPKLTLTDAYIALLALLLGVFGTIYFGLWYPRQSEAVNVPMRDERK